MVLYNEEHHFLYSDTECVYSKASKCEVFGSRKNPCCAKLCFMRLILCNKIFFLLKWCNCKAFDQNPCISRYCFQLGQTHFWVLVTFFISWAWTKTDIFDPLPPHLDHVVIERPLYQTFCGASEKKKSRKFVFIKGMQQGKNRWGCCIVLFDQWR